MKSCIIGGGHAGWWTAGYFEKHLPDYDLTVYESEDIPILGVGESTLPQIKIWFDDLGISEETWMPKAQAIKKYGNWKSGWDQEAGLGDPFTLYFWQNDDNAFDQMMKDPANYRYESGKDRVINKKIFQEEFAKPQGWRDYGYHLDAANAADIVKNHCKKTKNIKSTLKELPSGYDLYIDCTGFQRKFVQDKTEMPISKYHYADSALVCQVKNLERDESTFLTKSIARSYGWQFEIRLKNRVSIGYVYSSSHVNKEMASLEFEQHMINGREKLEEPRLINWKPLVYANPWSNNVVAIGSSAGFVDPLEATALVMTQTGISTLVKCLKRGIGPRAYNKLMIKIWKECLDFQLTHYALNGREDTEFWRHMREIKDDCSKMLWKNYQSNSNKYTNLFPSGIWCQLGVYLDDFKYYSPKTTD